MTGHDQISSHCAKEEIIPKTQHGFQKGKSAQTALISMFDQWQQAMERVQSTGVILFDLSSSFDTLDHEILAKKLASLNFSDQSLKWVKSFLEGRKQQVQVGKALSSVRHLELGVPQGSVLSPLHSRHGTVDQISIYNWLCRQHIFDNVFLGHEIFVDKSGS
jgi:retron-type reverse transcriptase